MKSKKALEKIANTIVSDYYTNKKIEELLSIAEEETTSLFAFVVDRKTGASTMVVPSGGVPEFNWRIIMLELAREFYDHGMPLAAVIRISLGKNILSIAIVDESFNHYFDFKEYNQNTKELKTKNKIKKTWMTVREAKKEKSYDQLLLDIFTAYRMAPIEINN